MLPSTSMMLVDLLMIHHKYLYWESHISFMILQLSYYSLTGKSMWNLLKLLTSGCAKTGFVCGFVLCFNHLNRRNEVKVGLAQGLIKLYKFPSAHETFTGTQGFFFLRMLFSLYNHQYSMWGISIYKYLIHKKCIATRYMCA